MNFSITNDSQPPNCICKLQLYYILLLLLLIKIPVFAKYFTLHNGSAAAIFKLFLIYTFLKIENYTQASHKFRLPVTQSESHYNRHIKFVRKIIIRYNESRSNTIL